MHTRIISKIAYAVMLALLFVAQVPANTEQTFAQGIISYESQISRDQRHIELPEQVAHQILDSVILTAQEKIRPTKIKDATKAVETLTEIAGVLDQSGFTYGEYDTLTESVAYHQMDCEAYSLVYYAIGQSMQLPIVVIMMPSHMAIQWRGSNFTITWECTTGQIATVQQYINDFRISKTALAQHTYLAPLSQAEMLALVRLRLGLDLAHEGKLALSVRILEEAEHDFPNAPIICNSLGNLYTDEHLLDKAEQEYVKTIALDPGYELGYYNLAVLYQNKQDTETAIVWCTKGIAAVPNSAKLYALRAKLFTLTGQTERAKEDQDTLERLEQPEP